MEAQPREIQYKYLQTPTSQFPLLGERIHSIVETSAQWRKERDAGTTTTTCLIALIPRDKAEDISFIFSAGHQKGLELLNELQPEEESEIELCLAPPQANQGEQLLTMAITENGTDP